ncbi:hypothetical protein [Neisseria musculi]|uniref:hypothetical protein n=1 Tax=Neisseria musculi TaxID=1815583 RepID=UPI00164C61FC|nr:hypothetical protein [Neisseria musculi]
MTPTVSEKTSYFVRASVYPAGKHSVETDNRIRVVSLILESPPLRVWQDLEISILPELEKTYSREIEIIDIEAISPVCWPNMFAQKQEKHTAALKTAISNQPGSGKTAFNSGKTAMKQAARLKVNKLPPETEQFFDGFLLFHLIPKAEYETEEKLALIEYYLSISDELSSLSGSGRNRALREKMYAQAEQLIAAR